MDLKLHYYGHPVLRQRTQRVEVFDDELKAFGEAMISKMYEANGIGLAAPQVGVSMRVCVAVQMQDQEDTGAEPLVLVNPEILERSKDTWVLEEGCLSIPGLLGDVQRPETIRVRYQDTSGETHEIEATGMYARVLQHEIDHLDGRLFIDYFSIARKSLIKGKLREISQLNNA